MEAEQDALEERGGGGGKRAAPPSLIREPRFPASGWRTAAILEPGRPGRGSAAVPLGEGAAEGAPLRGQPWAGAAPGPWASARAEVR